MLADTGLTEMTTEDRAQHAQECTHTQTCSQRRGRKRKNPTPEKVDSGSRNISVADHLIKHLYILCFLFAPCYNAEPVIKRKVLDPFVSHETANLSVNHVTF